MNREDIIAMARETRLYKILDEHAHEYGNGTVENTEYPELERFADLVAKHTLANIGPEEADGQAVNRRKPMTDDQIMEMYNEPRSDAEMIEFARAIEAAHGIFPENSDCHGPDWTDRDGEYLK